MLSPTTLLTRALLVALILAAGATAASAQATIFVVRHAERADGGRGGMVTDPSLSRAGAARANALAAMLKDTKLSAVFATEFKRTQQTAAPAAKAHHVTVTTVPADNTKMLVDDLQKATGAVLVVGHSNTVPEIIAALGIATPVTISDTEFDNLFIVVTGPSPRLVRLRYR